MGTPPTLHPCLFPRLGTGKFKICIIENVRFLPYFLLSTAACSFGPDVLITCLLIFSILLMSFCPPSENQLSWLSVNRKSLLIGISLICKQNNN